MTYYKSKNELELEEARKAQNRKIRELEEENRKLKKDLEQFSEAYKKYRDYEKEELAESCYDLARENQKLKDEVKDLVERNIELDKKYMLVLTGNQKLKERIKELETTNKKRTADNWATFK